MREGAWIRVAVVDDREMLRAGIVSMLGDFGDLAVVAELDPDELPQWRGHADVVVVDAALPALSAAVMRIRERGCAVLALGEADGPVVQRAAVAGAAGLLVPSASRTTVGCAVREAARHPERSFQVWCDVPRSPLPAPDARLSRCERQVLALYAAGAKAQVVAASVGLSASTVPTYVRRIRRKYEQVGRSAASRVDLYRRAVEDGVLPRAADDERVPAVL